MGLVRLCILTAFPNKNLKQECATAHSGLWCGNNIELLPCSARRMEGPDDARLSVSAMLLGRTEAADKLSHEADALEVVLEADVLIRSVYTASGIADAGRERRCA